MSVAQAINSVHGHRTEAEPPSDPHVPRPTGDKRIGNFAIVLSVMRKRLANDSIDMVVERGAYDESSKIWQ